MSIIEIKARDVKRGDLLLSGDLFDQHRLVAASWDDGTKMQLSLEAGQWGEKASQVELDRDKSLLVMPGPQNRGTK